MKTNSAISNTLYCKIILMILLILPFSVVSQNYTLIGDRSYGTIGEEEEPLLLKFNNKIIIGGHSSFNGINGDKTEAACSPLSSQFDIWMLLIDDNFNIVWDKTIGGLGRDEIHGITLGKNNSIVFSGETGSDTSCDISRTTRGGSDLLYFILDSNGNKLLDNRYGSNNNEMGGKLIRCLNNDYLIFGGSGGGISGDKTTPGYGGSDLWLVRTDSLGNKLWDQTYGGVSNEPVVFNSDYFIYEINGSEIILSGRTASSMNGTVTVLGYGQGDAWVQKTDSNGVPLWDKMFGGSGDDRFGDILETPNGYLLLGTSNSKGGGTITDTGIANSDVWIVEIDTNGIQIWEKRYGGIGPDGGVDVQPAPDGGYWILGQSNSPAGYDITENSYGDSDYWIIKIDSLGNKLWDKRFGGPGNDLASNFIIMPDSSIIISGYAESGISSVKTDSGHGDYDYWVVHFNYYNNTTGNQNLSSANGVSLSPNPAKSMVTIKGLPNIRLETSLMGMDGRLINQNRIQGGQEVNYTMEDVSAGMYLLRFTGGQFTATVKVVKE